MDDRKMRLQLGMLSADQKNPVTNVDQYTKKMEVHP
jgi:hypothetical protein